MKLTLGRASFCIITCCAAIFATQVAAESSDPIKIGINEWTGQQLSAHIAGNLLTKAGYTVEYIVAGNTSQWTAMADGSLSFQPEAWSNSAGEIYPKMVAAGNVVVVGNLGLNAVEGWFYPPYMEERCPGLPHYEALYDCAAAFATPETFPNGRVIGYPADWGTQTADEIKALNLPFVAISGGSEGAMIAEMKATIQANEPFLMLFWAPHWIHSEIKLGLVTWDSSSKDCKAGVDQERGRACGFTQASVEKVVSRDFKAKWPGAFALIEKFTLTNDVQNQLIHHVDQQRKSVDQVAKEWVSENEAVWRPWLQ